LPQAVRGPPADINLKVARQLSRRSEDDAQLHPAVRRLRAGPDQKHKEGALVTVLTSNRITTPVGQSRKTRQRLDAGLRAGPPRPVRVAVIGLGYWGPNLARNFSMLEHGRLDVLCDQRPECLAKAGGNYPNARQVANVDEVIADPDIDAVLVATPVRTHHPIALAALQAGKHVLVEKPLTLSVETAEELVDVARSKGVVLMVDHVFVYSPAVRKIKEILDRGDLGQLLFVDSVRINLGLFQHDVNVVWDLAPHDLSIVDHLLGRAPRSVASFGAVHTGMGLEDVAYLNLDFGDGLIASFHVNWLSPVKIRYTMLGGSIKSLVYNDLDPCEKIKLYDSGISVRQDDLEGRRELLVSYRTGDIWSPHVATTEPLRTMAEHFVECIQHGRQPISDGEAGLRVVRILDAAQRSIKAQGGRITL
jgi:predicted dehydrogenase